ncbi:hypothetical protein [Streptomyces sp. NPDC003635]
MPEPTSAVPLPPRGLLARRRPASDADGTAVRQDPPPGSEPAPRLPMAPLPAGLLPLPPGFEPTPEAGTATRSAAPGRLPGRRAG